MHPNALIHGTKRPKKKGEKRQEKEEMDTNEVIERIRQEAISVLPKGSSLLLYGSRARGDSHEDSDWDLLIILDKQEIVSDDYDNYNYPFVRLGWDIGEMIAPTLYTKKEWDSISFLPYHKNVERDKIQIL